MSLNSWLIAGIVPGIERHPLKKLTVDEHALLKLLRRWQAEAVKAGHSVKRVAVAFEAGRDGFWLARWLRARGVEMIHAPHPKILFSIHTHQHTVRSEISRIAPTSEIEWTDATWNPATVWGKSLPRNGLRKVKELSRQETPVAHALGAMPLAPSRHIF